VWVVQIVSLLAWLIPSVGILPHFCVFVKSYLVEAASIELASTPAVILMDSGFRGFFHARFPPGHPTDMSNPFTPR